jgi:hypothetical protein
MLLLEKIRQTEWWSKASSYNDRHYEASSGVMLSDHLNSVLTSIDKIFTDTKSPFISGLLSLLNILDLDKDKVREELSIVALLHDIGKPEDDKTKKIEHPLKKELVSKRHPVIGVQAAIGILDSDTMLSDAEKNRIYILIDEHDTPYAFYRQFEKTNIVPEFKSWKKLSNKLHEKDGAGLLYLLIFKLADIDGHDSVADVIWFFKSAQEKYYNHLGLQLPIPTKNDIR